MKKVISNVLVIISAMMLIWFFISFIEIVLYNTYTNYNYSDYNAIKLMIEYFA